MEQPTFSVITIAKNAGESIRKTLQSVASQRFKDFEYIVVDGGSTDDTIAIVRQFQFPRMVVVSEPDRGISHAMNKGVGLSAGKLLIHLNAGDALFGEDVLDWVARDHATSGWDWAVGACVAVDVRRGLVHERRVHNFDYESLRRVNFIPHQSTFVARTIFERFGGFDETFKLTMDYDLWLRIGRHVHPRILPITVSIVAPAGASSHEVRNYWEYRRARIKNGPASGIGAWLFEGKQFAIHAALEVVCAVGTWGTYHRVKKSALYRRVRNAVLGEDYMALDTVFTTTVRTHDEKPVSDR